MVCPAPCFVHLGCTDDNHRVIVASRLTVDQPLGACGGLTAYHANGLQFIHPFSKGHKQGHAAEWLPPEVLVQSSKDDPDSPVGEPPHDGYDVWIKKLGFINPYHGCFWV